MRAGDQRLPLTPILTLDYSAISRRWIVTQRLTRRQSGYRVSFAISAGSSAQAADPPLNGPSKITVGLQRCCSNRSCGLQPEPPKHLAGEPVGGPVRLPPGDPA
jgi:hypothetical protein